MFALAAISLKLFLLGYSGYFYLKFFV